MAIIIGTAQPELLLQKVKKAITTSEIKNWLKHEKKDLFSYSTGPYALKAWFIGRSQPGELHFDIIFPMKCSKKKEYYAIYHGRMIGMLLAHFDEDMEHIGASVVKEEAFLPTGIPVFQ